jgi:uncharacterized membrane protein
MDYKATLSNQQLRTLAKRQLRGAKGQAALVFLVFCLMNFPGILFTVLDSYHELYPGLLSYYKISIALTILMALISGPLYLGFAGYFLKRARGEKAVVKDLLEGFKYSMESFLLVLFSGIFIFLWSLLLIVPGIMKSLSYSMAFFIMYDNPGMKPLEAIKRSRDMMKGNKLDYLVFLPGFTGWILLGVLTAGIGFFRVYPYMYLSAANFYENLKRAGRGNDTSHPHS